MRLSFRRRGGRFPLSRSVLVLAGLTMVTAVVAAGADADARGSVGLRHDRGRRLDDGAIRAAAAAFNRLRWSSGELTRRVHVLAVKLENLAALAPSNICADVRAYAATGFAAVSESTADFMRRYEAANVEAEEVPQRLLTPYEGPRQVQTMRAIKRLEWRIAEFEAHAVKQLMAVERGLHLSV